MIVPSSPTAAKPMYLNLDFIVTFLSIRTNTMATSSSKSTDYYKQRSMIVALKL